jgi:hypothetical protein
VVGIRKASTIYDPLKMYPVLKVLSDKSRNQFLSGRSFTDEQKMGGRVLQQKTAYRVT